MSSSTSGALPVVFRDRWLCAVDKPCGLMIHRSKLGTDSTFVLQILRKQLGQRVWPIHRLDRATSGVLLFALNAPAAAAMGEQMMARQITKVYLAIVRGHVDESGVIDHALRIEDTSAPQDAQTQYRCLSRIELPVAVGRYPSARYSLVEARPLTGRMHQIRRHFKHIFHPIIGDTTYGEGRHNRLFREHFECRRLLLHASELSFQHPASGQNLVIEAPPTGDLQRVMERFG